MTKALPVFMLGAVALAGCGNGNAHELEGSLSVIVGLKYDSAELVQSQDELSLRFIQKREAGEDTPFKLTYNLSGTAVQNKVELDLAEERPQGGPRTSIARDVLDDPRSTFPAIERGGITFDTLPEPGGKVTGELWMTFTRCTQFACGRTVFGNFEANVP